jgi:hypothetical protein
MRIVFFVLSFLLLTVINGQNNLRIYSGEGEVFIAYMNGAALNEKPEANLLIANIKQDTVKIKIEFNNGASGEGVLYLLEKGKPVKNREFNYLLVKKDNKIAFSFAGTHSIIRLPDPLVPIKPVVDTSYKLRDNVLGHYCELKNARPSYFNNIPVNDECTISMPEVYMNYMNLLMGRAQNEDDKFLIAYNTCQNNCVSVSQLNRILVYIPYEIEKLKLIKEAYFHVSNRSSAGKLDSTMKLESTKKELKEFLKIAESGKVKTGINCSVASSESALSEMCSTLSVFSNDSERFQQFKKIYGNNCYSANQVKLVLSQFIHDREKLDAAKMLYYYCTEKSNFTSISLVFSYNSSVADLQDFVNKQKK